MIADRPDDFVEPSSYIYSEFTVIQLSFFRVSLLVNILFMSAACLAAETASGDFQLSKQNYAAWREHILPGKKDLGWQQIPWLTTFQDGILDANQRKLPLLFWTMNGHPLGCT